MAEYTVQPTMPAVQNTAGMEISYRDYGQMVNWKRCSKKWRQKQTHGK